MRIVISSGHGKKVPGAIGPKPWGLDEHAEAVRVVNKTAAYLRAAGAECITFEDTVSTSQNENLNRIVDFHNAQSRDLDISVHFNAYESTSKPMGTEVLYVTQDELADEMSASIALAADLPNRGPKERTDLFFLNNTDKPAILIEVCFVDSSVDAEHYHDNFEAICVAIRQVLVGDVQPIPPEPQPPQPPTPTPPGAKTRPTISQGDYGSSVRLVQESLGCSPIDGDFGPGTKKAVEAYQLAKRLGVDGTVGPQTWAQLQKDFDLPPYPPPFLPPLPPEIISEIEDAALTSDVADLDWPDRGVAPDGFLLGVAHAYATVVQKYERGDGSAHEMAKAATGDPDDDALVYYRDKLQKLGMDCSKPGRKTLRTAAVFLMGLGMCESSGQYCCGRDTSAGESSQSSETCEAGAWQTSHNYSVCATDCDELLEEYRPGLGDGPSPPQCALRPFQKGVDCDSGDWENVGSGIGRDFQALSKECPQFAFESAAIGIRNIRGHWGPINRMEVFISPEAEAMFAEIDRILATAAIA
jgi:N-acetylmuramoyl-L-alanine amidase-like protein/putative peptidoglycan binding protein